ncbi:MAG: hypothetical protein ACREDO_02090 [Methyloceanibacter sp.]
MLSKTGRISLGVASTALFSLAAAAALAETAEESKSETIGPWEIEATFKDDKFDRCAISRTLDDDIMVTLVRTDNDLTLNLESPNWKLERGKQYPVKMNLGPQSWDKEVAAEANSVSMDVGDEKFERGLRTANALNLVAAGATISVPLDKSTAALARLDECVAKNSKAVETNPFVAPARQP